MKAKKNLVLLGMMGVGKSAIGKQISNTLKINFFDVDKLIEKKNKMKVSKIFELKGESFFRKEEEMITIKCLNEKKSLISLGGGAFLNDNIRKKVLLGCISIWLIVNLKILHSRLKKNKNRPLIDNNKKNKINKIFMQRKKYYSLANHKVNCDNQSIMEISNKIIKLYEKI